jgi:hypothetical protein
MPDEAYWTPATTTTPEIISADTPLDLEAIERTGDPFAAAPVFRGRFKKGFDSRRHQFTDAERSRGFWTAIAVHGVSIGAKLHAKGRWPGYRGNH